MFKVSATELHQKKARKRQNLVWTVTKEDTALSLNLKLDVALLGIKYLPKKCKFHF